MRNGILMLLIWASIILVDNFFSPIVVMWVRRSKEPPVISRREINDWHYKLSDHDCFCCRRAGTTQPARPALLLLLIVM